MTSISFEEEIFKFTPDNRKPGGGLSLSHHTKMTDVLLHVSWKTENIKTPFILKVYYYNSNAIKKNITYTVFNFQMPLLYLPPQIKEYEEFICNYVSFEYEGHEEILLNISAHTFDEEKEKAIFLQRESNNE